MGFRRLLKRAVKPAAMALIAGGMALSLVVTTPSNAQAFVPPVPVPVVFGATQMVLPELMATGAVLGPVGWTIAGAAVLGIGLYATRDYWMPYVTGAFGSGDNDNPAGTSSGTYKGVPDVRFVLKMPTVSGASISVPRTFACGGSGCGMNHHMAYKVECKNPSTGAVRLIQGVQTPIAGSFPAGTNDIGAFVMACNQGSFPNDVPSGGVFGLAGSSTSAGTMPMLDDSGKTNGPTNNVSWGTMRGDLGFDPRSPEVRYESTAECVRPDGSTFSLTATSYGGDGRFKMSSCDLASPGSHGTGKASVVGFAPGATQGENIWSATAPVPAADKPLCGPTIPGTGCKLGVYIDTKPCVVGTWDCEHWPDLRNDPNQAPRVSCQYGPYSVPIGSCNPLERAYEPNGAPASEENLDGNPSTRSDTMPDGQIQPRESTLTPTVPGTGVVPGVAGAPGSTASTDEAACWPTGWGMLNPLEWVYKPVVCASRALFEPTKDVQTRVNGMSAAFSNKIPVSWFGVGVGGVSGGACPTNWAVELNGHSYSLICGSAADGIIRGFRPVLGGMLVMAMLWPLIRSLFYSAIPVFKVTPS